MIWKTSIKTAADSLPDAFSLAVDGWADELVFIGPSLHGHVYRSRTKTVCYRVLAQDEVPLALRNELGQWFANGVPDGSIRIAKPGFVNIGPERLLVYIVRYEVPGLRYTLAEGLRQADLRERLRDVTIVLRTLPAWWNAFGAPLLLMPADIVLAEDEACLLAMPSRSVPGLSRVFAVPQRAAYLAPQILRSGTAQAKWDETARQSVDLYAAGLLLLQCFYGPPVVPDASEALWRAANETGWFGRDRKCEMPFWMERTRATAEVLGVARKMTAMPSGIQPPMLGQIARRIADCRRQMDPVEAVTDLRKSDPKAAYALLQDILLQDETPTAAFLVLGGDLASELDLQLEAIDFYERAIADDPTCEKAYQPQFAVIVAARNTQGELHGLFLSRPDSAGQFDIKLWRNFRRFSPELQQQHEIDMAEHLVWRGEQNSVYYQTAVSFVYPRLFDTPGDPQGTHLFWKFGMNIAYAKALLGLGQYEECRQQINTVKAGLCVVRDNATLDVTTVAFHAAQLADLERELVIKVSGCLGPRGSDVETS